MENHNLKPLQYVQITDVGCVRDLNEDTLFCGEDLWLVADGMGGHACGEVASQLAAQTIAAEFSEHGELAHAIEVAHRRVVEAGNQSQSQYGMGTTVVAVTSEGGQFQVAWVGDSRAYLWDANRSCISQLSEDHSLMVRLINSGLISKEDAQKHPQRHMITQCLGSVEIEQVQVDSFNGEWLANQQILLCSDGLSDDVSEEKMSQILIQSISNQEKVNLLTAAAKAQGGKDNISIVLIDSPVQQSPSLWQKFTSLFNNKR